MTLMRSLKKRNLNNPSLPLSGTALATWLGGNRTHSGVTVNEETALGLPTYLRGIMLLSSTMASTPLRSYRAGTRETAPSRLLEHPHPDQTPYELLETAFAHAIGWGNAYLLKIRDGGGAVIELWILHPRRVKLKLIPPTEANRAGKLFEITDDNGKVITLDSYDVLHLPGFSIDGKQGLSPVRFWATSLGTALAEAEYSARFYGSGSLMSGILTTEKKLSEPAALSLKNAWRDKVSGLDRAHEIAVLDSGAKFQPVSISPADAKLIEARNFSVVDVARMLGIPNHLLNENDKESSWGTGIEQIFQSWIIVTLRGWFTRFEQRISAEALPSSIDCRFDLNDLRRGDMAARAEYHTAMVQNGVENRAEVRDFEGLPPAPADAGLTKFMHPANIVIDGEEPHVGVDGKAVAPVATKGGGDAAAA